MQAIPLSILTIGMVEFVVLTTSSPLLTALLCALAAGGVAVLVAIGGSEPSDEAQLAQSAPVRHEPLRVAPSGALVGPEAASVRG